jgi:hypothetical protein
VETLEHFPVTDNRLNRILMQARFASSVTEADKLIKTPNCVSLERNDTQVPFTGPAHKLDPGDYIVRVGKKYKHVTV